MRNLDGTQMVAWVKSRDKYPVLRNKPGLFISNAGSAIAGHTHKLRKRMHHS